MDLESATCHHQENNEKEAGLLCPGWLRIKAFAKNVNTQVYEFVDKVKKLGQDDPRRVFHSLKVGVAITLVSLLYYYQPMYDSFGDSGIWAVITVFFVFEFTVGAVLAKGMLRGVATFLGGALAVGTHHLANRCGRVGEPILLSFFAFIQAAVFTFARFYPKIKARYDYGFLIFIMTFSFIAVSGYRNDDILTLAYKRLTTILIGGSACIFVSILFFPVWAGQELHNLIASHIGKLASFLEGFGDEFFEMDVDAKSKQDKSLLLGYKTILNSRNNEDALANFARWEPPGHGRFQFRHPWKQYLKIGALTRKCAYRIESLNGYLNSDIQAKSEFRSKIQDTCIKMSSESSKALKELAVAMETMVKPFRADIHIAKSKSAAKNLNSLLKSSASWDDNMDLLEVVPVATVASLLIDVVNCTEEISESIHQLASMANFKGVVPNVSSEKPETGQSEPVKSSDSVDSHSEIVVIDELSPENGNSSATTRDHCSSKPTN